MDYLIYFSPLFFIFAFLFFQVKGLCYLSIVYLVVFIGLRGAGGDIEGYTLYYNASNAISDIVKNGLSTDKSTIKYSIEFFYSFINSLSKSLDGGLGLVFFIVALFFIILTYHASKKFNQSKPYIFFSIFIITSFAPLGMHYIRQGLATAFIAFAIAYYKSPIKKKLALILAVGSHLTSGIVGIALVYVMHMKKRNITVFTAISIIGLLFFSEILGLISFIFTSMDATMLQRYPERFGNSRGISSFDKVLTILVIMNYLYLLSVNRYMEKSDLIERRFAAAAIFYIIFVVFASNVDLFSRYFTFIYPFLLYFSYEALAKNVKQKSLILIAYLFLACLIFFKFINDKNIQELFFPYKFILGS